KRIAPEVFFIPVKSAEAAAKEAAGADAVLGYCTADIVKANPNLRWIQVGHAGVEKDLVPDVVNSKVTVTNTARLYGPNVSDQAMALLLALTRGLAPEFHKQAASKDHWKKLKYASRAQE